MGDKIKATWYSEDLKRYYRSDLNIILKEVSDSKQHHTFSIMYAHSNLRDRYHLNKCLWSLENEGLIILVDRSWNFYKWQITDIGLDKVIENNYNL